MAQQTLVTHSAWALVTSSRARHPGQRCLPFTLMLCLGEPSNHPRSEQDAVSQVLLRSDKLVKFPRPNSVLSHFFFFFTSPYSEEKQNIISDYDFF